VANPDAVLTVDLTATNQKFIAPGEYDITSYSDRGTVMGYQRASFTASETRVVDPSVDDRPRLTVRFSAGGWKSGVTESTPRGGAVNWVAMIAIAGALEFVDVPATPMQSSELEDVYLLSRAGRMQVHIRRDGSPTLWREITVRPRESVIINAPRADATLEAPSNFDPGKGHVHGIAGPRMQLIADDPGGWSITEFIPQQTRGGTFVIRGIPPGDYHLHHHLFNGQVSYTFAGKSYTSTGTPAAWGGVAVHLVAGKTTRIASLNTKLGMLNVKVSDAVGNPVNNATFRVRDRMSDSWRQIEENPAQVEQAGLPIPYPAAVRIIDGKLTLPQVRSGLLEFAVETDAGSTYSYALPVALGQELKVTVPSR
jgi:hypothetical protein